MIAPHQMARPQSQTPCFCSITSSPIESNIRREWDVLHKLLTLSLSDLSVAMSLRYANHRRNYLS
jgi:hypothetical protein